MKAEDQFIINIEEQEAVLSENDHLRHYLGHFGGALVLFGPECVVLWTNQVTEQRFGIPGPVIGMNCHDMNHHTPEQCDICPIGRALATGNEEQGILDLAIASGELRSYEITATPILGSFDCAGQVMALARDVTERVRVERELHKRTERLEIQNKRVVEASKQKSRFIASLSHELRTPLTSIIGFSQILLEDTDDPLSSGQKNLLGKVNGNAERLLGMINDLLDLAKMESGHLSVNTSRVDLCSLIAQVVDTMQPLVRGKEIALSCQTDENLPIIRTDEQKLCQILVNLVSNAIKFTPEGSVTVSAGLLGSKVAISVTDTGIGIRRTDFGKIFDEFHQVEAPPVRREGTGLGLAITRRLVYLLGGEVHVSSKLGEGSTFTVTLPVSLSQSILNRRFDDQAAGK